MNKEQFSKYKKSLLAIAVVASFSVNAQQNDEEKNTKENDEIETITVEGNFQQSLVNRIPVTAKELPFTLDIVDGDLLENLNFTNPIEALTTLPNISRTEDRVGTGTTTFLSRGFEAPILVDNRFQNNFRGMGARDNAFVERYEILKGPASIASGPVGAGGIINTVTKSPQKGTFYSAALRADQFGSLGLEFDANLGEIASGVLFRVSGAQRDFEFDADHISRQTTAIRPVVIVNFGDVTTVKTSVSYREVESNPNGGFPLTLEGEIPDIIETDTFTGLVDGESNIEDVLYDIELNHQFLDNLKLTVRGSKQSTDNDYKHIGGIYSYDGLTTGAYTYLSENAAKNTLDATFIDAQLAYQTEFWGQQQDFVVGVANAENEWTREFAENYRWEQLPLDQIGEPQYGWDDENFGELYLFQSTDQTLKSVFAETAIRPNDALTITAGIRYDKLEQENFRRFPYGYDDEEVTTRIGASYSVSNDINVYASFAQAFVPQYRAKKDGTPTEAEISDGIEFGLKGALFDNRIAFQTAVFSTKRKNLAVTDQSDPDYILTAGEVDVEGFELSSTTIITDELNLSFNVGYTDIDVSEKDKALGITNPVFPEVTGSLYLNYEVQSGALDGLILMGGVRHVGERKGIKKDWDSHNITDFNASYPISEEVELSVGVLNLTDEKYIENTQTAGVNKFTYGAVLGAPRTVTMTLRWKM